MKKLREEVAASDAIQKKKQLDEGPKAAFGYGGKFGIQTDRWDFRSMNYSSTEFVHHLLLCFK